jgi:hypothetical protein
LTVYFLYWKPKNYFSLKNQLKEYPRLRKKF